MPRGLYGDAGRDGVMPLEEIAARLGISTQRAQQLVARALAKARRACAARGIEPGLFWDSLQRDGHACPVEPPALEHPLAGREPVAATRARPHGRTKRSCVRTVRNVRTKSVRLQLGCVRVLATC